ncbi:hypothetical protein OAM79_01390 [Litorivicinus sp.]|nr:hypothetical protein [Litorivicinus sp.]
MRLTFGLLAIVLISGCSGAFIKEETAPQQILDTSLVQPTDTFVQYLDIARYFEMEEEVPYIVRSLAVTGLPTDFRQTFVSLSDMTETNAYNYFFRHPEFLVGMQDYLNHMIRTGFIPHDQGKQLLLSALKGSLRGFGQTPLPEGT